MATQVGATGAVTSWTNNSALIATGSQPSTFALTIDAPAFDTTGFDVSYATTAIPRLKSWSGTISTRLNAAEVGSAGLVAFSDISYYAINVRSWTLNITRTSFDDTSFSDDPPVIWRAFLPGLYSWTGSYSAGLDGTTAIVLPVAPSAATNLAALTLTMATGTTFAGDAHIESVTPTVGVNALNTVVHTFRGSGELTAAGTQFFGAGAIQPTFSPGSDTLVLTASTGRTYTGSAFWNSVTINCAVDGLVTAEIGFQGTGALTVA